MKQLGSFIQRRPDAAECDQDTFYRLNSVALHVVSCPLIVFVLVSLRKLINEVEIGSGADVVVAVASLEEDRLSQ